MLSNFSSDRPIGHELTPLRFLNLEIKLGPTPQREMWDGLAEIDELTLNSEIQDRREHPYEYANCCLRLKIASD